jgi:antitoxin VapB
MSQMAKLFKNGRSQAVRLPAAFRFDGDAVYIRRDPTTGDVILSAKPRSFDRFFAALAEGKAADDFLSPAERGQEAGERDPFGRGASNAFHARRQHGEPCS